VALAALVLTSAAVLGYTALADLFGSTGLFSWWLRWLFPVLFDAMEVAAAVAVFNARLQGEDDRFAWKIVVWFTLLGVAANMTHALVGHVEGRITGWQMVLAMSLTSLFPVSVALSVHLLKGVLGRHMARTGAAQRLGDQAREEERGLVRLDRLRAELARLEEAVQTMRQEDAAAGLSEKERLQGDFLRFLRDNPRATLREAGEVVGRAESTVKDWVSDLKEEGRLMNKNGHGWEVVA
jgi:hypothetical protein